LWKIESGGYIVPQTERLDRLVKPFHHTPPILCKYFCKSLCPILTAAEGFILGIGTNMFKIAGPVIVYGTVASVVYGLIYWITTLF
jgi:hypothetical protein